MKHTSAAQVEVREYAFKVWRANGRDFSKTERQIKKEDFARVSRQTLSRWANEYGWGERATALDMKEQEAENTETMVLKDLLRIHDKLMDYLNNQAIDEVDTAKVNSLISNAKQIADITMKIKKNKLESLEQKEESSIQFNLVVNKNAT